MKSKIKYTAEPLGKLIVVNKMGQFICYKTGQFYLLLT
jgi:hypothetical protein